MPHPRGVFVFPARVGTKRLSSLTSNLANLSSGAPSLPRFCGKGGKGSDVAAFVLAGGRSSRMGSDKALVQLAGRPMIAHALAILRDAGLTAAIAGARSPLAQFAPIIEDESPDSGPLAGICAALASTAAQHAVFLSVDQPLIPPSLIAYMTHHAAVTGAAVTLASVNGVAQTFPAILDRAALPHLRAALDAGRLGCFAAFQSAAGSLHRPLAVLPVELLAQCGAVGHSSAIPAAFWLSNINTPADLARADALRAARDRVS